MDAWQIRGVQLDLARQMESIDFIAGMVDFMAGYGLNVLVLYLEGRVKTASFPYPPDEESYTPRQMREIVRYARERDVEVMPVVSTLGHCGQFLRYPELEHLAELRGGRRGRFGTGLGVFCPSLEETFAFWRAYLGELAEIFPFEFLHIGCDEVWDIGFCDQCRPRAEGGKGQGGIFADYLLRMHGLVTGELKRRMAFWDDMLEHYPEALERLPSDCIPCCWQYENHLIEPAAHFNRRERIDRMADYRRRGLDALAVPRELSARNIAALTRYAAPRQPLGGFVSTWEHSRTFLYSRLPNIALAGHLWERPERADAAESVLTDLLHNLCPQADAAVRRAWTAFLETGRPAEATSIPALLVETSPVRRAERRHLDGIALDTLAAFRTAHSAELEPRVHDILDDTETVLRCAILQYELRELVPECYRRSVRGQAFPGAVERLQAAVIELEDLHACRREQWRRWRPGIQSTHDALEHSWQAYGKAVTTFARKVADGEPLAGSLLVVEYVLPESFSAQHVRILGQRQGAVEWREIAEGIPKPLLFDGDEEHDHAAFFRVTYPLAETDALGACRIESWGHGGIGVRSIEQIGRNATHIPAAIEETDGTVADPDAALSTDSRWCALGEPDTGRAIQQPALARARHRVTFRF